MNNFSNTFPLNQLLINVLDVIQLVYSLLFKNVTIFNRII